MLRGLIHLEFQKTCLQFSRCITMKEAMALGIKRPSKALSLTRKKAFPPKSASLGTVNVFKGMSLGLFASALKLPDGVILKAARQVCPNEFHGSRKLVLKKTFPEMQMFNKVARMFNYNVQFIKNKKAETTVVDKDEYPKPLASPEQLHPRPPVVTIMGHVDHGKTTLLDALRESRIVDSEFGGITQHIGAFSVTLQSLENKPRITFLDTPGHAAFSAMRQRGADATDIVVLVIAADDGVMAQTEESIRFASIARVPIIVAVNKIDSPRADVESVLSELVVKTSLLPESHGGEVQCVPISALKRRNLELLQEAIIAQAEILDLRAETEGPVEAVVIEAQAEKGRGKMATCLVRRGRLEKGASLVAGSATCRVRAIYDEMGNRVSSAGPSDPVEVAGWRELPDSGDLVLEVKNETRAAEVQRYRRSLEQSDKQKSDMIAYRDSMSSYKERYDVYRQKLMNLGYGSWARSRLRSDYPDRDLPTEGGPVKLHILIKGDVQGSVEAIVQTLGQIQSSTLFELCIVAAGVGEVTESNIELADTFKAIIYAFNVPPSSKILKTAEDCDVSIREFNVIYHLAHDVRDQIVSIIPNQTRLELLGTANVLQIFKVTKEGTRTKVPIAGCFCDSGVLRDNAIFRILRHVNRLTDSTLEGKETSEEEEDKEDDDHEDESEYAVIFEGPCSSMFHKKEQMTSIKKNLECGLQFTSPEGEVVELSPGDRIECYEEIEFHPEPNIEFDFE